VSARVEARLWVVQRATAVVLAVCVAVHLVTIVYAVRGGLAASDVLARTRGNAMWASFYAVFVLASAAHGSIGLRTVAIEWLRLRAAAANALMGTVAIAFTGLGLYAVYAVARA
jgi:fumarate reductase subunit C